jgi:hypothetical protein
VQQKAKGVSAVDGKLTRFVTAQQPSYENNVKPQHESLEPALIVSYVHQSFKGFLKKNLKKSKISSKNE